MTGSAGAAFGDVAVRGAKGDKEVKSSTTDVAARLGVPLGITRRLDIEPGYGYRYHTGSEKSDQHGPFLGLGMRAWTSSPHVHDGGDVTWWMLDLRASADLLFGDVGSGSEVGFGQTVSVGMEWVLLPGGVDLRGTAPTDNGKRQSSRGTLPLGVGLSLIGGHHRLHQEEYWTVGIGMTFRMATGLVPKFKGGLRLPIPLPLPLLGR